MASILDEPAIRNAPPPISVEFFHRAGALGLLGEDVELLEGTLVTKISKSPLHESIVWMLFELLERSLPPGRCLLKEAPLTFSQSEPEPDLAVVLGARRDFRTAHPSTAEWVIEVAVSTLEVDRRKAPIYAAAGVKEYWIVVPEQKCIEVYRGALPGGFAERSVHVAPCRLESTSIAGFAVDLAELFREAPFPA